MQATPLELAGAVVHYATPRLLVALAGDIALSAVPAALDAAVGHAEILAAEGGVRLRTLDRAGYPNADGPDVLARCRVLGARILVGRDEPEVTVHFTGTVRLSASPPDVVRERADALSASAVDDPNDPFSLVRLDGDELSAEPSRLVEFSTDADLMAPRAAAQ